MGSFERKSANGVLQRWAGKWCAALAAAAWLGVAAGCGSGGIAGNAGATTQAVHQGEYPIKIAATCGMVTDIVRQVAGDKAEVTGLMGPSVDPHLYKPTRHDVSQLQEADVIIYSGLMLEGRMSDVFARIARGGKPVYAVTEGIDPKLLREPPEFEGHYDPHAWMDPTLWSQAAKFAGEALAEYDPKNAEYYRKNAEKYLEELAKLDAYVKQATATIPKEKRLLVTAHDAFGYFAAAYGFEVRSVQGISTESEASVKDVNDLVRFVVENKVPALFVESSVASRNLNAVVEGAQQQGWTVRLGGELFSDAMGAEGMYEGTYIGMIDHNATTIVRSLGGEAPERGMQGKLSTAAGGASSGEPLKP